MYKLSFVLQAKLPDIFLVFLYSYVFVLLANTCFDATGVADIPPACIVAEKS